MQAAADFDIAPMLNVVVYQQLSWVHAFKAFLCEQVWKLEKVV